MVMLKAFVISLPMLKQTLSPAPRGCQDNECDQINTTSVQLVWNMQQGLPEHFVMHSLITLKQNGTAHSASPCFTISVCSNKHLNEKSATDLNWCAEWQFHFFCNEIHRQKHCKYCACN